jgi:hypothetical protein
MVDSGAAPFEKPVDGRSGSFGFQQFHERITGLECLDPCAIGIVHGHRSQTQHVPEEGGLLRGRSNRDSDVREMCPTAG